jgi:hypothetical protein
MVLLELVGGLVVAGLIALGIKTYFQPAKRRKS